MTTSQQREANKTFDWFEDTIFGLKHTNFLFILCTKDKGIIDLISAEVQEKGIQNA